MCDECGLSALTEHILTQFVTPSKAETEQSTQTPLTYLDVEQLNTYHRKTDDALCTIHKCY